MLTRLVSAYFDGRHNPDGNVVTLGKASHLTRGYGVAAHEWADGGFFIWL